MYSPIAHTHYKYSMKFPFNTKGQSKDLIKEKEESTVEEKEVRGDIS
jgi:hypothetical protein